MTEEREFGNVEPMMGLRVYLMPEGLVAVEHAARDDVDDALSRLVAATVQGLVAAFIREETAVPGDMPAIKVATDAIRADCGATTCAVCRETQGADCVRVGPHERHVCSVCEASVPAPAAGPNPDDMNGAADQGWDDGMVKRCQVHFDKKQCPQDLGHSGYCFPRQIDAVPETGPGLAETVSTPDVVRVGREVAGCGCPWVPLSSTEERIEHTTECRSRALDNATSLAATLTPQEKPDWGAIAAAGAARRKEVQNEGGFGYPSD